MRLPAFTLVLLAAASATVAQEAVVVRAPAGPARTAAREVARVNGVPLLSDRLDAALNTLIPLESFHRSVHPDKMVELQGKALRRLVDDELWYQEGVRLGLRASDAQVDARLERIRQGYTRPELFEQALRRAGMSAAAFRHEIRRALTIEHAYGRAVAASCQVSLAEASRFFTDHPERFIVPEQLHVYAITIGVDPSSSTSQWTEARSRAEAVLGQLRSGAPFEQMARQYSTDPARDRGGDMGFFHRGSLSDEFETVTRNLAPGTVSEIVQTLYGYHIIRVAEIRPAERRSFAEVRTELQKDLTVKRCGEMAEAWIARLRTAATIAIAPTTPLSALPAPRPRGEAR